MGHELPSSEFNQLIEDWHTEPDKAKLYTQVLAPLAPDLLVSPERRDATGDILNHNFNTIVRSVREYLVSSIEPFGVELKSSPDDKSRFEALKEIWMLSQFPLARDAIERACFESERALAHPARAAELLFLTFERNYSSPASLASTFAKHDTTRARSMSKILTIYFMSSRDTIVPKNTEELMSDCRNALIHADAQEGKALWLRTASTLMDISRFSASDTPSELRKQILRDAHDYFLSAPDKAMHILANAQSHELSQGPILRGQTAILLGRMANSMPRDRYLLSAYHEDAQKFLAKISKLQLSEPQRIAAAQAACELTAQHFSTLLNPRESIETDDITLANDWAKVLNLYREPIEKGQVYISDLNIRTLVMAHARLCAQSIDLQQPHRTDEELGETLTRRSDYYRIGRQTIEPILRAHLEKNPLLASALRQEAQGLHTTHGTLEAGIIALYAVSPSLRALLFYTRINNAAWIQMLKEAVLPLSPSTELLTLTRYALQNMRNSAYSGNNIKFVQDIFQMQGHEQWIEIAGVDGEKPDVRDIIIEQIKSRIASEQIVAQSWIKNITEGKAQLNEQVSSELIAILTRGNKYPEISAIERPWQAEQIKKLLLSQNVGPLFRVRLIDHPDAQLCNIPSSDLLHGYRNEYEFMSHRVAQELVQRAVAENDLTIFSKIFDRSATHRDIVMNALVHEYTRDNGEGFPRQREKAAQLIASFISRWFSPVRKHQSELLSLLGRHPDFIGDQMNNALGMHWREVLTEIYQHKKLIKIFEKHAKLDNRLLRIIRLQSYTLT